jgi:uncharacterized protein (TIGR03790 family)
LAYQWRRDDLNIANATQSTYTTPATTSGDNSAQYSVVVSNSAGSVTSNAATLTVNAAAVAPSLTAQPVSTSVTAGSSATFNVAVTGTAPLSYQWRRNGVNISGANAASHTTPATTSGDNSAQYSVVVSNSAGSVTSNAATLTVSAAAFGPNELALVVAEGDATGEAIARAYQRARGVPEANIVRVPVPTSGDQITAADFASLKATLDARLPARIQATLLTWTAPSRVKGSCTMSITSALAFGFDAKWCGGCSPTAPSPYYNQATRRPFTDLGIRPSMMLGLRTPADAEALIARGVAADGIVASGRAVGTGWLMRTTDRARSVRYFDFMDLMRVVESGEQPLPGVTLNYIDNSLGRSVNGVYPGDVVTNKDNVLFYLTGLKSVPQITSHRWLPGAIADHLTSSAGNLPNGGGQMPVTDWLRAGATASYGTVEEPCNYTEKFPQASSLIPRYVAGETLIEAYWKSVYAPGPGLFVGEPLARPFAR